MDRLGRTGGDCRLLAFFLDVRVKTVADGKLINEKIYGLRSRNPLCRLTISGGINRPPMERTQKVVNLYRKSAEVGAALGLQIDELSTGGGSDGNFTAALGVPTLDGLGAVGEGAHATNESIVLEHLAPRMALLAGLIAAM